MKWETRFCVFFPSSFYIVTWYFILALRFICLRVFFFFFYKTGEFYDVHCYSFLLNHGFTRSSYCLHVSRYVTTSNVSSSFAPNRMANFGSHGAFWWSMLLCHLPYFFFFFADRNESGVMFPFEMFLDLLRYLLLLNNQLLLINKRKKRGWNKSAGYFVERYSLKAGSNYRANKRYRYRLWNRLNKSWISS